ncbi:Stabilin 2 [Balamuthia mandrillaris]
MKASPGLPLLLICLLEVLALSVSPGQTAVLRWRYPGVDGGWDDPTNWIEEETGVARVPTKEDDVILGGYPDRRFWGVYTVSIMRIEGPVEVGNVTLAYCNVCEMDLVNFWALWNGTQYSGPVLIGSTRGILCGVVLDIVAPTTFHVHGEMTIERNSFLQLSGSLSDPFLKPTVLVGEGEGNVALKARSELTGNGEIYGNLLAEDRAIIRPLVWWKGQPHPEDGRLGGSIHVHGNMSMKASNLIIYVNGFNQFNYSNVRVDGDLYMEPPVFGGNVLTVQKGGDWMSLLEAAQNSAVRSPSLILYNSISGSNGTKFLEEAVFSRDSIGRPEKSVASCEMESEQFPEGEAACQQSSSRHDLSFLLASQEEDLECPPYSCPGTPECSDRGTCQDGYCVCNPGWAGLDCSAEDCPGSPDCNGHGYCLVAAEDDTPSCQCLDGWTGEACQSAECPNDCTDQQHGYCDTSSLFPKCVCYAGFVLGSQYDCSVRFMRCPGLEAECSGYGTCDRQSGSCSCVEGRTGPDCSIPVCGSTDSLQCSQHGLCLWNEESNSSHCECDVGWTGDNCAVATCSTCSGHGACVAELDPPRCLCDGPEDWVPYTGSTPNISRAEGWTGAECDVLVTNCNSDVSRCGSRCGGSISEGYGCMVNECPTGWKGWDCNTPVCVNTGVPECHGHGRCVAESMDSEPQCQCREGWLPPDCRLAICSVEEGEEECSGRGKCRLELSPPRCLCDPFAYGSLCEIYDPPCPGEKECSGRGSCVNGTCHCQEDWRGLDCSIIDHEGECANNCSSNGVCKPSSQGGDNVLPVCHCFDGWYGTDCSRSSPEEGASEEDFMEEYPWLVPFVVALVVALLVAVVASVWVVIRYRRNASLKAESIARTQSVNF